MLTDTSTSNVLSWLHRPRADLGEVTDGSRLDQQLDQHDLFDAMDEICPTITRSRGRVP